MNISHYAKAIVYILLAVAGVLVTALADDTITTSELVNVGIIGVGAVGVYWAPNVAEKHLTYLKGGVAFVVAGLVALQSFLTGGITPAEWLQVAIAAFAGIGVTVIPNEPQRDYDLAA